VKRRERKSAGRVVFNLSSHVKRSGFLGPQQKKKKGQYMGGLHPHLYRDKDLKSNWGEGKDVAEKRKKKVCTNRKKRVMRRGNRPNKKSHQEEHP